MDKDVNIKISRRSTHIMIGKIITLILFGTICGILLAKSELEEYNTGLNLTKEMYMNDFEIYKANMIGTGPMGTTAGIIVFIFMSLVFFGIYELLGRFFGWIIHLIFGDQINTETKTDSETFGRALDTKF
jgi:hypothetical protein